ncbi:MAG: nuclear transport factor 2 family protein [Paracoccaceae bacterium]
MDRIEVLGANDDFYTAMRRGDVAEMERLWARRREVTCTHPNWSMLVGRKAVMDSWRLILTQAPPPQIWPADADVVVTGTTAMVICIERLGGNELMASNTYVLEDHAWRIMNHQAAAMPAARAN